MKRKLAILFSAVLITLPVSALAFTSCRDTDKGCTLEQLVQLNNDAVSLGLATSERIAIMQEMIAKLTTLIGQLQTGSAGTPSASSATCLELNNALVIGSTDATTNGEVSKLQNFLIAAGVYPEALVTGYYGTLTAQAVVRWEKAHGMDFVTLTSGVGPMTRAKMACGQKVAQCSTYDSKPVITSITPSSGPVGTTIEVHGCNFLGFEGDKEIWFTNNKGEKGFLNGQMDAATRASNTITRVTLEQKLCQINSYSGLQCPLMELVPGVYTVYSNSWGGNSNAVNFTVTAQYPIRPSITGIDAPTELYIGQTGTWTVRVNDASGRLSYSVVWGDEQSYGSSSSAPASTQISSSGSFTHAYSQLGTYTPHFTVTNAYGQSANTSATVVVGGGPVPRPVIEEKGKVNVSKTPEVQALIQKYGKDHVYLSALEIEHVKHAAFIEQLYPNLAEETGCVIIAYASGEGYVYRQDKELNIVGKETLAEFMERTKNIDREFMSKFYLSLH